MMTILEICRISGLKLNKNNMCRCPLHEEKTASFRVYPETESFYCFGCGMGGDQINLYAYLHNMTNGEAYKTLKEGTPRENPIISYYAKMADEIHIKAQEIRNGLYIGMGEARKAIAAFAGQIDQECPPAEFWDLVGLKAQCDQDIDITDGLTDRELLKWHKNKKQ